MMDLRHSRRRVGLSARRQEMIRRLPASFDSNPGFTEILIVSSKHHHDSEPF
jgi:hypothetical protein